MEWNDFTTILNTTRQFRTLLSTENPPTDQIIKSGAVIYLQQSLDLKQVYKYFNVNYSIDPSYDEWSHDQQYDLRKKSISVSKLHQLQYEASWAITNIASGTSEHTKYLVDIGCIPKLVDLLHVGNDNLKEHSLWALGNISGDSSAIRDLVLNQGALPILLQILETDRESLPEMVIRNAMWTVSNLLRGKPKVSWEIISTALPAVLNIILQGYDEEVFDEEVLADACWAVSYSCDGGEGPGVQFVIEYDGVVEALVKLLKVDSTPVQSAIMRLIGNLVCGNHVQTSAVLDCGLLIELPNLLKHPKKQIRKDVMWIISNITAGTTEQIQLIIDNNIIPIIISVILSSSETKAVKEEAYWALVNLCKCGNRKQIKFAIEKGLIKALCTGISSSNSTIISVILETIFHMLESCYEQPTVITSEIEVFVGIEKLEELQNHTDDQIQEFSSAILAYFEDN